MSGSTIGMLMMVLSLGAGPAAAACVGDCGGSGTVAVSDLIRGVNIALGNAAVGTCASFDADGDGAVTIAELVVAVGNALGGCRDAQPTPSPTPTVAPALPCGDTSSADAFFASRAGGSLRVHRSGGQGFLFDQFADPAGYQVLFISSTFGKAINIRDTTSTLAILPFTAEDVFDDQPHELNVLFNADPAQPLVGHLGILQCDKATGAWFLQLNPANVPLSSFVTFTTAE